MKDLDSIIHYARFISQSYTELDKLRYTTIQMEPHEIVDFMVEQWPVIQGTSNQLRVGRIGQQEYDVAKVMEGSKILDTMTDTWVKTEDEKPQEFEKVLIWPFEEVATWLEAFTTDSKSYPSGFYRDEDVKPIDPSFCTYWRYLPKGPTK